MFHKIHKYETRPLIRTCMPKLDLYNENNLRLNGGYVPYKFYNNKFRDSFFPYFSKLWNSLPTCAKGKDTLEFKEYINKELKPPKIKHFSRGNKYSNTLLTRIRVGRSDLNQH